VDRVEPEGHDAVGRSGERHISRADWVRRTRLTPGPTVRPGTLCAPDAGRRATASKRWQTRSLPCAPVATGGNGFGLISRIGRQRDLRPVATGCDHGAP